MLVAPPPGLYPPERIRGILSLFIDENSRERESLAENTNVFLESQLEEAKRRLVEHEQKLEIFQRSHAGELPSQLQGNLQAIQSAQLLLQSVSESINRARERTGVEVFDIEVFTLGERTDVAQLLPALETSAEIGASFVQAVSEDPDASRAAATFA